MREKTVAYFLAEVTSGFGNGECILLENIDSNGNYTHGLIDAGRKIKGKGDIICNFLARHNVKKLAFFCVTHQHGDHYGNSISVLNQYQVDLIIMKEYDTVWSPGGHQDAYENIIIKAVEKNIKILGISFLSLGSPEYSPSQNENFKNKIKNAKKENFEYFSENNTILEFGSATIQVMNWELFDTEGNLFIPGQNEKDGKKLYRAKTEGENENSLGILLFQGNKKAFFPGDMNNIQKYVNGELIGDEDRLKNKIGEIDLLKLGHHGYRNSNTEDYINILNPKYAIITNDVGKEYTGITKFLEKNNVKYLYNTQDNYEVCASIYNDDITLGFGTSGIKKEKYEYFYIAENKVYSDYLKSKSNVKYEFMEISVSSWEELKLIIDKNRNNGVFNSNQNCFTTCGLIIHLKKDCNNNIYNATSTITISDFQSIQIVTEEKEIIIKRDITLDSSPIFEVKRGFLTLGKEGMLGKIILDGNKENMVTTSYLVVLRESEFNMYDNIILTNNHNKKSIDNEEYGSAINANFYSKINIYGGEISHNISEFYNNSILPEIMSSFYEYYIRGTAIFMNRSIINMNGGKIYNNKGIINSSFSSNNNSTNGENYNIKNECYGNGISAGKLSQVFLYKGEIFGNITKINSKTSLITPIGGKITNLNGIENSNYGSAIFASNSNFEMYKDFIIQNNSSEINAEVTVQKNCSLKNDINSTIYGGQLYLINCNIKIEGGTIQNSNNSIEIIPDIVNQNEGALTQVVNNIHGGGIFIINCHEMKISNLKINNCNGIMGGGIYLISSSGDFINPEFTNNHGYNGGAIYIFNQKCIFNFINAKISNNSASNFGGGIYGHGTLTFDGEDTLINNNESLNSGGGIIVKDTTIINNGAIFNNKSLKSSGGGIQVDQKLVLNQAKIYENWCSEQGGGIYYRYHKFEYNKDTIDKMVYDNTALKEGNDFYPEIKK